MNESKMGYRVSKSFKKYNSLSVKEQRVDGSYLSITSKPLYPHIAHGLDIKDKLRCTLMVRESGYPVKILSNQRPNILREFSYYSRDLKLNP